MAMSNDHTHACDECGQAPERRVPSILERGIGTLRTLASTPGATVEESFQRELSRDLVAMRRYGARG